MYCPSCHTPESRVVDSRLNQPGSQTRRRRECIKCGTRFTTYERVEEDMPVIIKKDGRREEFSRDKILSGIKKAVSKRPITQEQIESLVVSVERQLPTLGVREVPSHSIGEWVMRDLRALDSVAYIRFASVYREFKDVREFVNELTAEAKPSEPPHAN